MRATVSTRPPGGNWHNSRTGPRVGQDADCACTSRGVASALALAAIKSRRFINAPEVDLTPGFSGPGIESHVAAHYGLLCLFVRVEINRVPSRVAKNMPAISPGSACAISVCL